MEIKAVVFDMDGVIFDSEKIYRMNDYIEGEKFGLPLDRMETYCNLIAGGTKDINKKHFEAVFGTGLDYMKFRQAVNDGVDRYGREHGFDLKPGVTEFLSFLKERNIKIAMATSTAKERAEHHLKSHGIFEYFDEIVYGNMVEHGKPEPDIYLKACEVVGEKPENCMAIEDSVNGVVSAHRAGMFTVMVVDLIPPNEVTRECADKTYQIMTEAEENFL